MNTETVVTVCAIVIALASLGVSVWQAHVARQHNRHSVRPVLQLQRESYEGARSGIRLLNVGLGPAVVVSTRVTLDGEVVGRWNKACADRVRNGLSGHLNAVTFGQADVLQTGYDEYLLSLPSYDPRLHTDIASIFSRRLSIVIDYESLYGGEGFRVVLEAAQ